MSVIGTVSSDHRFRPARAIASAIRELRFGTREHFPQEHRSARERRPLKAPGAHRSQRAGSTTSLPPTVHRNLLRSQSEIYDEIAVSHMARCLTPPGAHLAHTWRTPGAPLNSSSAHSCRTPVALLSHSCRTPVALLSHSCRTPVALLSHSCLIPWRTPGSAGADPSLPSTTQERNSPWSSGPVASCWRHMFLCFCQLCNSWHFHPF